MISLGIESTAHTLGVGIVKDRKILANARKAFTTKSKGMIPARVADHHVEAASEVTNAALKEAGIRISDVDVISFSRSPGIGHCLRIGAFLANVLAKRHRKPLIGVNHCIAHLEIGRLLTPAKDPIMLYASGANTQIIGYEGEKYRVFGETLDMGVGNFIDSFARDLELGFPGGPKVEELASKTNRYVELPYLVKGMDVQFGGLQTNLRQKINSGNYSKKDLCNSMQETVFAMLLEVSERALAHTQKSELLLTGGVACNRRLNEMAKIMCTQRGAKSFSMENQYNVDNGAMIAWLGLLMYQTDKKKACAKTNIDPYERTEQVNPFWR